jgi:hypothetical protein
MVAFFFGGGGVEEKLKVLLFWLINGLTNCPILCSLYAQVDNVSK